MKKLTILVPTLILTAFLLNNCSESSNPNTNDDAVEDQLQKRKKTRIDGSIVDLTKGDGDNALHLIHNDVLII